MIADSVAFCREQRQAGRLRRRALLRRLPRRPRLRARLPRSRGRAPAPRTSPSATPTAPACPTRSREATAAVVGEARRAGRGRHPRPRRRRLRRRQLAGRGARGRPPGPGDRQRLRRALRQRQPGLDPARAAAEDGLRGGLRRSSSPTLTETAHFVDELCNVTPNPDAPYVGRNAFAHKGGHARRRGRGRRPHLRAHRPGRGRQRSATSCPPSSPARRRSATRPSRPGWRSTTRPRRGRSSG